MTRKRASRNRTIVVVVAVIALLVFISVASACALPTDHQPRAINPKDLSGIGGGTTTTTTTTIAVIGATTVGIYLVNPNNQIQSSPRRINALTARNVMEQLVAPLTALEKSGGLSSLIPPNTKLLGTARDGSHITIDLSSEMNDVASPNDKVAYAQIVYTLVNSGQGITDVSVKIAGKATKIPTDTGAANSAGVSNFKVERP